MLIAGIPSILPEKFWHWAGALSPRLARTPMANTNDPKMLSHEICSSGCGKIQNFLCKSVDIFREMCASFFMVVYIVH